MIKVIYFLCLFLSLVTAFSQEEEAKDPNADLKEEDLESKFLIIQPFESDLFNGVEKSFINKMMLQVSTKQIQYQVLLSSQRDLKTQKGTTINLELYVSKNEKNLYEVKAILIDLKNKKIINKQVRERILKEVVIRNIQEVLDLLFLPLEKELEEKKLRIKNERQEQTFNRAPVPDKTVIDFKARILDLKSGLAEKFAMLRAEREKLAKKNSKGDGSQEQDQNKNTPTESNQAEVASNSTTVKKNEVPVPKIPLARENELTVSYINQNIDSEDIVKTNSLIQYIAAGYKKRFYLDLDKVSWADIYGAIGMTFSQPEVEIANYKNLYAGYHRKLLGPLAVGAGVDYGTVNFANLPEAGNLLQAANNNLISVALTLSGQFEVFAKKTVFEFTQLNVISSSSDYETINNSSGLVGSGLKLKFAMEKVVYGFGASFEYTTMSLSASGPQNLTAASTQMAINGVFTF